MVLGFAIRGLAANTAPALESLHTSGKAIDTSIAWTSDLEIANKDETTVTIKTTPRTGMNTELKAVGQTYGVKKFYVGAADKPH
jgi:hypothetical protein